MGDTNGKQSGTTKLNAMQKAATTHDAAMRIIDAEITAREKKTERLRRLRLEKQAEEPLVVAPAKRTKRKA